MVCFKKKDHEKWLSDSDLSWLEYDIGGWDVGEQAPAEAEPESS